MSNSNCCISDILNAILILQNNCGKLECIPNACDRPILGSDGNKNSIYNTRPLTFYNCNNTIWCFPYTLNCDEKKISGTSTVFRIEKLDGCCATCRVLAPNYDTRSTSPYVTTDSFFTINLNCVCILKCLPDTFISCI